MIKDYYKAPPNNFLFPILRPHLFLVNIKISIIPYSLIIFWLFLRLKNQSLMGASLLVSISTTMLT